MTKRQEDKITMWTVTNKVLENFIQEWSKLPAFETAVKAFRKIRLEVDPEASIQKASNKGYTVAKEISSNDVITLAKQMALNIETYAMDISDPVLENQFHFEETTFIRTRDNALPALVKSIAQKAKDIGTPLEAYGVTKTKVEALLNALKVYNIKNPGPTIAKGKRKNATINVAQKIEEATAPLKRMDNLIGNFNDTNREFVATYLNARIVIKTTHKKNDNPPDNLDNKE